MTVNYTSLLGLALPVTGTEAGAWGDVVNNYLTSYLDASVAGTQTITGSQTAVTLAVTNGATLVTVGSGATGSAQFQIITCTGNPASLLTITAPASSRQYIIINSTSTSQSVKIVGAGPTTGVTIVSGEKAHVAWNGSDFVKIATQNGNGDFVTVDTTNLEVTNIKAKDGTASMTLADSTGVVTFSKATVIETTDNTNAALRITQLGTGNALLVEDSANPDTTPFVVTATGDVGIGTSSPVSRLNVSGTTGFSWVGGGSSTALVTIGTQGTTGGSLFVNTASVNSSFASGLGVDGTYSGPSSVVNLKAVGVNSGGGYNSSLAFHTSFETTLTERMRLDSPGNLGLGVTPSAWSSSFKALQVSNTIIANNGFNDSFFGANYFFDGTNNRYINTDFAAAYGQVDGTHRWFTAPSGTANSAVVAGSKSYTVVALGTTTLGEWQASFNDASNNPLTVTPTLGQVLTSLSSPVSPIPNGGLVTQNISFTQAMTLLANGNLGIGETNPAAKLQVAGGNIRLDNNQGIEWGGGTNFIYGNNSTNILVFTTNNTERARITSTGGFETRPAATGHAVFNEDGVDADFRVEGDTDTHLIFADASTDRVGIGTNNPAAKLETYNSAVNAAFVASNPATWRVAQIRNDQTGTSGSAAGIAFVGRTDTEPAGIVAINGNTTGGIVSLGFLTVDSNVTTERMRIDSSGNLGLGVTPSANWGTVANVNGIYRVMQVGATAAFGGNQSLNRAYMFSNVYWDGSNYKYLTTGPSPATWYEQSDGAHYWFRAASGSGGATISQIQAMTLDASGFLVVGDTTTNSSRFTSASTSYPETTEYAGVFKAGTVSPLSNRYLLLRQTYTGGAFDSLPLVWEANADVANQKSYGVIQTIADGSIVFSNKAAGAAVAIGTALGVAERARITSGGYFKASDNGTYNNSTGTFHEFYQSANNHALIVKGANASQTADIFVVQAVRNTTNNSFYAIQYYNTTAAATRFRVADSGSISTAGSIQLGDAGAPPTSGVGVKFPATQSASSDANTLDDYEEGTWTPTMGGATFTYTSQGGRYTKVGNVVTVWAQIDVASYTSATGLFSINNLPFTVVNDATVRGGASTVCCVSGITFDNYVTGEPDSNSVAMYFESNRSNNTRVDMNSSNFAAGGFRLFVTSTYQTSA